MAGDPKAQADQLEAIASGLTGTRAQVLGRIAAELRGDQPPALTPNQTDEAARAQRAAEQAAGQTPAQPVTATPTAAGQPAPPPGK